MTAASAARRSAAPNPLAAGRLARGVPWALLAAALLVSAGAFTLIWMGDPAADFDIAAPIVTGVLLYAVALTVASRLVEGSRRAVDRLMTTLVTLAFVIALLPLISLAFTVITRGLARLDLDFFTMSMRNIVGAGGGGLHAIVGTLLITLAASVISIPVGILTAVYLVEYGRGRLARAIRFFVDVMTGIPSIVAGLFAYALFALVLGPGVRLGVVGAVALSVLMIPVVVRSSEEMLRLVPNELREAAYALGVPKWATVLRVVLPTSIGGIVTGVMLAVARVIGETAPLLVAAGFTANMNWNLFENRMQSLPVFVYTSYVSQGTDAQASLDRAWTGALVLIAIVVLLNVVARILARAFAPRGDR